MLSYRLEGDGPALLLVHGFGISFHIWRKLRPLLRPHFKLVMVELPGIGQSVMSEEGRDYLAAASEGIEELRQALHIEKWHVLGYSSGSRIAEAYIQQHPAAVCHAAFLCPLKLRAYKAQAVSAGLWLDRYAPALGTWILSGGRLKLLISWLGFNFRADPLRDEWYEEISNVPVGVLRATLRTVAAVAARPFSVPVAHTMIWADKDLVVDKPRLPAAHDRSVHGRHAAPLESAREIADILISSERGTKTAEQ